MACGERKAASAVVMRYMAFVFLSNFATIGCFLSIYLSCSGFSLGSISMFLLLYEVGKLVFEIPAGFISDRWGRRRCGLAGLAGIAAYYLVLLALPSAVAVGVAFVVRGVACACVSGSFEALFIDAVDEREVARFNALERFVFYVAYGLSAIAGGLIAQHGLYWLGLSIDAICVVSALLVCRRFKNDDHAYAGKRGANPLDSRLSVFAGALDLVRSVARNHVLICCFIMDFSQALTFIGLEEFYTLLLEGLGFSMKATGIIIAVQLVASAGIGLLTSRISGVLGPGRQLTACAVIRLVLTGLMLCPGLPPALVPVFYMFTDVLFSLFAPIKYGVFQSSMTSRHRATLISAQSMAVSLGGLAFYAASSALAGFVPIQTILLGMLGITCLLYIPSLLRVAAAAR